MNAPPAARALIAEDEPLLAAGLAADLRAHWPGLEIVACVGDGRAALAQALELKPDIAFLDIRMPGLDGLEVAAALVEEWPETERFPLLVFVTAYEQHALVAFERQAVDYLVKPVAPSRLLCAVQRLQRQMVGRAAAPAQDGAALAAELQRLHGVLSGIVTGQAAAPSAAERLDVLPTQAGNLVHLVPVDDVVYFEAADKYVRVVTAEREHLIRMPLKELLPRLDPARFWQVHRGTIVQARCIAQARRDESGKVYLALRGRPETLVASRLYAHLFKGL